MHIYICIYTHNVNVNHRCSINVNHLLMVLSNGNINVNGPMSIEAVRLRGRLVQQRAMQLGTMEMGSIWKTMEN